MTAIYAHRGNVAFAEGAPSAGPRTTEGTRENTLEAFDAARRAGADGVELDVRLSADDLPVIQHNRRLPDGRDVANIVARSLPDHVAPLAQALRACRGISVNVEIKHEEGDRQAAGVVAALLRRLRRPGPLQVRPPPASPLPPVLVSSFDDESLAVVRDAAPGVPLGLLIDWRTDPRAGLARAKALGCATLHPFVTQVDADLAAAARAEGITLHVWTVNADADLAAMGALGVAAVITDRVTAAVRILRQRPGTGRRGPLQPREPPSNGDAVTG